MNICKSCPVALSKETPPAVRANRGKHYCIDVAKLCNIHITILPSCAICWDAAGAVVLLLCQAKTATLRKRAEITELASMPVLREVYLSQSIGACS